MANQRSAALSPGELILMFGILLFIVAVGGLMAVGWWKGGARIGLALAPLLICSIFLWIAGSIAYQIDMMRNLGLVWPAVFLIVPGLVGGYLLRYWLKKKLPDEPGQRDRVMGAAGGFFMGIVITWLGLVYQVVWVTSHDGQASSFNMGMARTLNNGVVRWIPGIGVGSGAIMDLVDVATAPEDVQRQAVKDLGLDKLSDTPEMQAIVNAAEIREQIESIRRGNVAALWRLQKDERVLALFESAEIREILDHVSLDEISEAVKRASENSAGESDSDDR